jgi:hypothetical protein
LQACKRKNGDVFTAGTPMNLKERSKLRRRKMVGHRAKNFADAERWDLEFWQSQTPEMRLSALVAIHHDIGKVRGRNTEFDGE